jgi:kynurenine formamidase
LPRSSRSDGLERVLGHLAGPLKVFPLGRPMENGMPQSPSHPPFRMALQRRHGDMVRADGGSAASEIIVTGGHVGTHVDALSHVSQDGHLHDGVDAEEAQRRGSFSAYGIDTVSPFFCRGLLLDVAGTRGVASCEPAYEVTAADLEEAAGGRQILPGDTVLIRTGWGRLWEDRMAYIGFESGVPGPGEEAAKWLASFGIRAAGSDTIAFERAAAGAGHSLLPVHRIFLVEHGIHIIETLDLEGLAAARAAEFLFVMAPLPLVGATGSPVNPLAIVGGPDRG